MSKLGAQARREKPAEAPAPAPRTVTAYVITRVQYDDGRVGGVVLVEAEVPESAVAHGKRSHPASAWETLEILNSKINDRLLRGKL